MPGRGPFTYTFAGLDPLTEYTFTIFGAMALSDGSGEDQITEYSLTNGVSTDTDSIIVLGNSLGLVVLSGRTLAGGMLDLTFSVGGDNDWASINAVRIDVVPELASLALLGLGGTLMLMRRRKA